MSLSDYTSISSEQVALLATMLSKRELPFINQFEPIADFEELHTFSQENPTPTVLTEQHPAWRLESVAARTIEAIAIASHEPLNELEWDILARILIEHAEYLYTFPDGQTARERLTACTALALVGCICSSIQQSELWRLTGFGRIALMLNDVPFSPLDTHITEPLNAAFSLADALNLKILDAAMECYNSVLNCTFTSNNKLKFPLSHKDFFQYLNLDYPRLQDVKSAVSKGETKVAMSKYTQYRKRFVSPFDEISDLHNTESYENVKLYLDCLLRLSIYPSPAIYGTTEIAIATLLIPEFRIIEQLRRMASRRFKWISESFFYPDGFHKDRSINSHLDAISDFSRFLQTVDMVKPKNHFACLEDMRTLFDKQIEACIYLRQPDLSFPPIASNSHSDLNSTEQCKFGSFDSSEGNRQNASYSLPYTGYYVMRNSWESDAHYLLFDVGMKDTSNYQKKLSFVLHANGQQLITHDHKSNNSDSTPYNVVLIDGDRQPSEPQIVPDPDARWISTSAFNYVEGWHKSDDYQHKRSIFYIKGGYFILHDLIIGAGEHLIAQCFHLCNDSDETNIPHIIPNAGQILTQELRHSNLFIGSVDMTNVSPQFNGNQLTYQAECDLPINMNVVIFPIKTDVDQYPVVNTLHVESDDDVLTSGFTVESDYGTDIYMISDDGYTNMSTLIEGKRIEVKGEYLFLRGDKFVLLNGQYLKVGSEVFIALNEPCEYYKNFT